MMSFKLNSNAKILLLAPHTDDIEIGAGAFVSKAVKKGAQVCYVAFSDCCESLPEGFGKETLRNECLAATALLGIPPDNVHVLNFPVRNFDRNRQEILEYLISVRNSFKPSLVLTPSLKDMHQDHQVIAQESIRAFKQSTILAYQFDWNCLELTRNVFFCINQDDMSNKIKALSAYKSQSQKAYFDPNFIKSHFSVIGSQFGFDYAEAFELVRMVVNDEG
jgi:LmbE family N-acetylglucosaminyl deacetylase